MVQAKKISAEDLDRVDRDWEFWCNIFVDENGCWIWGDGTCPRGYCRTRIGGKYGRKAYVHVLTYLLLVGAIPDGLELDHLCRVNNCCNPAHLEPITHKENVNRGRLSEVMTEYNKNRRTACAK